MHRCGHIAVNDGVCGIGTKGAFLQMSSSSSSPGAFFYIVIFVGLSVGAVFLLKDYSIPDDLTAQVKTRDPSSGAAVDLENRGADIAECIEGYRQFVMAGQLYEDFPPSHSIAELKEMGLADPVNDLKADLKSHPELIPYKGRLGGTMGFRFPDKIYIASSQWVLAYFEDGHVGGMVLLKFAVSDKGLISWKVADSFLY